MYIEWDTKKFMNQFSLNPMTYAESFSKATDPNFPDFYGISINDDWGNNSEKFINTLKLNVKMEFHPKGCDTIKSVVDHEIGHQLDKILGISEMQEVREIFDSITVEETKTLLSGYSAKNSNPNKYSEPIAEAWSEYCNNPNPRMIAKFVGDIIVETYSQKFEKR